MARELLPLKAEAVGSGRIDVSWKDNGNLPLYLSFRKVGEEIRLVDIPSGEESLAFVGLSGRYEFQLFSTGRVVSELVVAEAQYDS